MANEYQEKMTEIINTAIVKTLGDYIGDNSYYQTERFKKRFDGKKNRNDLYVHLESQDGCTRDICIEIKNNVADLHSGFGMGFNEDYNFLAFAVGHTANGPIRMHHLDELDDRIGILAVFPNGTVVCVRSAKPVSCRNPGLADFFRMDIGLTPDEYVRQLIELY